MTHPSHDLPDDVALSAPDRAFAALKLAILGEDALNGSELSQAAGIPSPTIARLWRAMGFSDFDPAGTLFTRADLAALANVRPLLSERNTDSVLGDARVLSSLLARVADVVARGLLAQAQDGTVVLPPVDRAGSDIVQGRLGEISALLDYVFRRQLLTELTRQLTSDSSGLATSAMGLIFADLVGFTHLSQEVDDQDLAQLVGRFQTVAFDLVAARGGRVVKTLGDEVMVACDDPGVTLELALALARAYSEERVLPEVRVGVAYGPVLAAQGDLFGPTVNLASRLVAIAPPGLVLVSDGMREALGPSATGMTRFGPRRLKGMGWTTAWLVEPGGGSSSDEVDAAREGFYAALLDDDAEELYERAPCGYLSTTADGLIVKVNQTFLTWTGYTRADLVGQRRFVDLLSGGGRIYHETHYAPMLLTQGTVREIALDIVRADQTRLSALVNAVLERDAHGAPAVVRTAVFDATDRREYERELLRAKRRAEESEHAAMVLARTLQQSLIPPDVPTIPGLELAAAYRPAGSGEEVGGDFYDVFQIDEGDWFVVIGDVCGKGAEAAVVTALARYTIRAAAATRDDPAAVLHTLNAALMRHGADRFCTVAAARLRREESGGWMMTFATGGHPLPLFEQSGADGELPTPVGRAGTVLGVIDDPDIYDSEVRLKAGDQLVFFTDGITEGKGGGGLFSEGRLRESAAGHDSAAATVDRVLADVLDFQGGWPSDDIAIIGIRVC